MQRQRLALACAIATGPRLLLADEPTSALGHEDRDVVVALLHRIGDQLGTTIVVVTHSPDVAATFPRTVTMRDGRVGAEGRDGAEYVVLGEDGDLHLPVDITADLAARHRGADRERAATTGWWSAPRGRRRGAPVITVDRLGYQVGEPRRWLDGVDLDARARPA